MKPPPNMRVQRTRFASLRSPLTRKPLGGRSSRTLAWVTLVLGLMLTTSAPTAWLEAEEATQSRTASWIIIPGQTVGPVRFGMSREEVQAAIGVPDTTEIGWNYRSDMFTVVFRDEKVYSIFCGVGSPDLDSDAVPEHAFRFKARTQGGTRIGSTRDEVLSDLGTPSEQRLDDSGAEFLRYRETGLNISLWRGHVYNIAIFARPAA